MEEGRLAELRAELARVPTDVDVESTELASLERQELEALRSLAVERCPETLAWKQKALADTQASNVAKQHRNGGWDVICLQESILGWYLA